VIKTGGSNWWRKCLARAAWCGDILKSIILTIASNGFVIL
jgi:hypothetical protein